jgi:isopentenyl-diphosphate delta-isomerase
MNDSEEQIVLVDSEDRETGVAPKLDAHRQGLRHRAISVCVLDRAGRMLLQRRAEGKYHSGGLWTNACCTHPRVGETVEAAARRRLKEEMGVDCELQFALRTHYRADVGNGLVEDEIVHLFVGVYDGAATPDPAEVAAFDWVSQSELRARIAANPERYTYWFRHYMRHYADRMFSGLAA